jgi:hypothetical protein
MTFASPSRANTLRSVFAQPIALACLDRRENGQASANRGGRHVDRQSPRNLMTRATLRIDHQRALINDGSTGRSHGAAADVVRVAGDARSWNAPALDSVTRTCTQRDAAGKSDAQVKAGISLGGSRRIIKSGTAEMSAPCTQFNEGCGCTSAVKAALSCAARNSISSGRQTIGCITVHNAPTTLDVERSSSNFTRDSAAAARLAHNQEVAGSTPAPATKYGCPFCGSLDCIGQCRFSSRGGVEGHARAPQSCATALIGKRARPPRTRGAKAGIKPGPRETLPHFRVSGTYQKETLSLGRAA